MQSQSNQVNETPTDVFLSFIVACQTNDEKGFELLSPFSKIELMHRNPPETKTFSEAVNNIYGRKLASHIMNSPELVAGGESIGGRLAFLEVERFGEGRFDTFVFLKQKHEWKLALELERYEETTRETSFVKKIQNASFNFFITTFDWIKKFCLFFAA